MALGTGVEIIALFWRCTRLWYLEHIVGSNDSVREQDLNTSCRPHGGPKYGSWRSSQKLGIFPGGTRGVQLKSKAPLSFAFAESRGLILDGQKRFRVRVAWERRRSQGAGGKTGSQLVMPAIRWSLKFCMARTEEFVQCRWGGSS